MSKKLVNRIATSAVLGGVATLALATPASAARVTAPDGGSAGSAPAATAQHVPATYQHPSTGPAWQALPVATGALGGIALAGAGVAVAGFRRRRGHLGRPA